MWSVVLFVLIHKKYIIKITTHTIYNTRSVIIFMRYLWSSLISYNNDVFLKLYKALHGETNNGTGKYYLGSMLFVGQKETGSLSDKSYQHCLITLDLPSLHHGNIRGDLIFLSKPIYGHFNLDFYTFTLSLNIHTKRNSLKFYKPFIHCLCRLNCSCKNN